MGLTFIEGTVSGTSGESVSVRFLVDSGAGSILLPADIWPRLGLTPKRSMEFTLADGSIVKRQISECLIQLPQGTGHTPVILGEAGDTALLGVIMLEELGLVLNPLRVNYNQCG